MHAAISVDNEDRLVVTGELTFANVPALWRQSVPLLSRKALHFDLSGVKNSGSAGLALLMEWVRYADRHRKSIQFTGISEQLRSLAKTAEIESLFKSD